MQKKEENKMSEMKEAFCYIIENKKVLTGTVIGLFVGAVLGVVAYYNGWLG